jgi:transposase
VAAAQRGSSPPSRNRLDAGRIARLERSRRDALAGRSLAPVVAEIQDFHRFANPRQLMASLGVVPDRI